MTWQYDARESECAEIGGWRGGGGQSMRDLGKSIDYLLIFLYLSGRAEIGVRVSLCVCVCMCVCVCTCGDCVCVYLWCVCVGGWGVGRV